MVLLVLLLLLLVLLVLLILLLLLLLLVLLVLLVLIVLPRASSAFVMKQVFGLLRFVVKWFFISTVAYSVFDLAVGSKLVPTSSVHIAETSDKTFEDVVGIDEVI